MGNSVGGFFGSSNSGGVVGKVMDPLVGKTQQAAAPDYKGAAEATAAGNLEAAQYATMANRANQVNPYGSLTWQAGATKNDPWTQTVSFTPQGQKLFDLQQNTDLAYGEAAQKGFENIRGLFENPNIDESKLTAMPTNAGMTSQQAMLARLQPTLETNEEALRTRLANQGIGLGSTAYGREQNLAAQRANDLYLQAAAQGIGMDMNARQQGLNEQYQRMQQPLNMINALKTGSQVQAPQFGSYAQQATTQGPNMMQAAQEQYGANLDVANAQNAMRNNMMQGLFSLGSGAMMSDKRLKKNIKLVGKTDGGTNIYTYNYVWGGPTQMGVMAQEVEKDNPEAVVEIAGYKAVNYSKVK